MSCEDPDDQKIKPIPNLFPWYDSPWLSKYTFAKEIIRSRHPERLSEFELAFLPLRTSSAFQVRKYTRIFEEYDLQSIRKEIIKSIVKNQTELHELESFRRYIIHNHPFITKLHHNLVELVSEGVGEPVEPCYNFMSLYRTGGNCQVHMDAPEAKWTLDVCIEQSEPWPIHFSQVVSWPENYVQPNGDWEQEIISSPDLQFTTHSMETGNALLFSGSSQWHYRKEQPLGGSSPFCNLIFFHFIPAGMGELVQPQNWARLFNIPELAVLKKKKSTNSEFIFQQS
jgi:hypothetical protein